MRILTARPHAHTHFVPAAGDEPDGEMEAALLWSWMRALPRPTVVYLRTSHSFATTQRLLCARNYYRTCESGMNLFAAQEKIGRLQQEVAELRALLRKVRREGWSA